MKQKFLVCHQRTMRGTTATRAEAIRVVNTLKQAESFSAGFIKAASKHGALVEITIWKLCGLVSSRL